MAVTLCVLCFLLDDVEGPLKFFCGNDRQVGSLALGGFYLIVVYLGDYWINLLLGLYFSAAGIGSVWNVRQYSFCLWYWS